MDLIWSSSNFSRQAKELNKSYTLWDCTESYCKHGPQRIIILAKRLISSLFSSQLKHIQKREERIQKVAKKKTEIISTNSTQFTKSLTDKNVAILVDEVPFLTCQNIGETPLYLYVNRGYNVDVLSQMLKTCTPPEYGGPDGKTALHAAVIRRKGLSESSRGRGYLGRWVIL